MRIKDRSVKLSGIVPEIMIALLIIDDLYNRYNVKGVITSGSEETTKHMDGSKHRIVVPHDVLCPCGCAGTGEDIVCEAVDLRSSDLPYDRIAAFKVDVMENIGPEFDFIYEGDHFHLEWDVN